MFIIVINVINSKVRCYFTISENDMSYYGVIRVLFSWFKMNITMLYCPPNVTLSDIWMNNGTSECFMDTITSSVVFGFLFLFGTVQLLMYKKYGTEVSPNQLTKSRLYILQIFFTLLIPVLAIIRFVLQGFVYEDHDVYIYMVRMVDV